ncbi:C2H2 finger domain protein [Zopfia rhizophila CBS 207.26]|uniref:C2H2 finger domain protein n=1 Tax=Zopfia rhizophila CBS 207.26 TaxID=1314779 RepID=A0A6A6EN51_9PEZI|nr:C2H2 finger domain protein [Zopfia rhizophila CBS 207.26]
MRRCASERYSSSSAASDDDSEYVTDLTSVDEDTNGGDVSDVQMTDEECLQEEHARPPEYYRAHAEDVNKSDVVQIDYADSTMLQFGNIEEQWQRLRGTKESSSLGTYWKQYLIAYKRATGRDMGGQITRQMHQVLRQLAVEYQLSNTPREKPPMDVYDVREVLQTTLTTTKKMFKVGRYRIQTSFFMQGGFITANRPEALLKLQYQHIKVTILRDPQGGPHRILLELTYEFTKTFLGPKAPNTFPIPEILFDPSLVLSPHVFLLGLMFADDVFSTPGLAPEHLSQLDIRPGCNALELPLKPEMAHTYVFRQCTPTSTGWTISNNRLPDSTIRPHMKDMGEITGFKQVARPYCLRYGSGKAFDKNGNISDALRNLIMQHSDTRTFLNHYLSRRITADTQAIVRGVAPQDEIMQAACRMSRWIDPERPWKLTTEQSASVNEDPRIQRLLRRQAKLKGKLSRQDESQKLGKEIRKEKQRLRHALRVQIRKNWDREQAERDIQLQLSGAKFSDKMKTNLKRSPERTPQHNRLIETVLSLPGSSLEEEAYRRSAAINAIIAYCNIEEGGTPRVQRARGSTVRDPPVAVKREGVELQEAVDPPDKALEAAKVSVYKEKRPTICWVCLGNEGLPIKDRIHSFYTPGDLTKHFNKKHLKKVREGECFKCDLCQVSLGNKEHWQRHGYDVHGTVSQSSATIWNMDLTLRINHGR